MKTRRIRFGVRAALQSSGRKKRCDCSKKSASSNSNYGGTYIAPPKGKRK